MNDYFDEAEFDQSWNGRTVLRILKVGLVRWKLMLGFIIGISSVSLMEAYLTYLVADIIDNGVLANDLEVLNRLSMRYLLIWIPFCAAVWLFIISAGYLGHVVARDMRQALFDHLQKMELAYFNRTPTGWLQSRVTSDVGRVADLVSWGFLDMLWAVINIIASFIFMWFINWRLTIIVALVIPALFVIAIYFKKLILTEYRKARRINSQITSTFSEGIAGVRVIKALRRERANMRHFTAQTDDMYNASYRAAWLSKLFLPIIQVIGASGIALIVWFGGWQISVGNMTLGGIQAFVGYITFMLWPVQQMAAVYAAMQQAIASAERVFSLMDMEPAIQNRPDAVELDDITGDITFDNVTFAYEDGVPVLENFSLNVEQGETIALVGPTGAGKSTIINLVARFYEPTAGSITMAGYEYRDLTLDSIQSNLGMVLQTPYLFSGTIMENIRYGRLDATDDDVISAATIAGAHDFIMQLDDGYGAQVGEDGVLLSLGQKQLLSIGRAILADPDIFIMDEATSSVDTLTERYVQQGMERLMDGRTSFVIAHRLSTIRNADRILVIDDGQISEMGSHDELMMQHGHYHSLYTKQFQYE